MSSEIQQVFIRGINPERIYTATVDLSTATTDDLFQAISFRSGIQKPLLQYQFRVLKAAKQIIPYTPLASQGVNREDTLRLEWGVGLFDNRECPICFDEITEVTRRFLFCQQGTGQMSTHRTAIHAICLGKLKKDGKIRCPLCRGNVAPASMAIP